MDDYVRVRPGATVNDRLAAYDKLPANRRCAPRGETAHYSFPQS